MDFGRNPPIPLYMGFSVNIPLRIFDRNQGEKARTQIDIAHAERQKDAAQAQVFSDVDSAYFTLVSSVNLLQPYRAPTDTWQTATRIRDTMSFSYQRGAGGPGGLPGRAARLPRHGSGVHQPGGRLPDRRQPAKPRRRPRSAPVGQASRRSGLSYSLLHVGAETIDQAQHVIRRRQARFSTSGVRSMAKLRALSWSVPWEA